MRALALTLIGVATAIVCPADDFTLKGTNSGPIKVATELTLSEKGAPHLAIKIVNQTGLPIQKLRICVQSPSFSKGCLFEVWTKREMAPNDQISVEVSRQDVKLPDAVHDVSIAEIEQSPPRPPSKFDPIRKVFVEEIGGNTGPQLRDRLIADLVNSTRFTAVEDPALADAVIRGRSDSMNDTTEVDSKARGGGGAIGGGVFTAGKSSSVTHVIVSESVSVRLTLPSGEVIWGWDDTKSCKQSKAKCAVDDLTFAATR
jgi:hypothetical protein